jgi:hypothetical protein
MACHDEMTGEHANMLNMVVSMLLPPNAKPKKDIVKQMQDAILTHALINV